MGPLAVNETVDITAEDYWAGLNRELADRLMAALELDPNKVTRLRVSPGRVIVWLVNRDPRAGSLTERKVVYDMPKEAGDG